MQRKSSMLTTTIDVNVTVTLEQVRYCDADETVMSKFMNELFVATALMKCNVAEHCATC